jgi:hypothetical protein
MKTLLAICLFVAATFAGAADKPAAEPPEPPKVTIKGEVLEVIDAASFTYLRLKTKDGEAWASVPKAAFKKGAQATIEDAIVMKDFKSKSLNRTFPVIYLGGMSGATAGSPHGSGGMSNPHAGAAAKPVDTANIRVAKAQGANAMTVAEIVTKGAALKDKPVLVRGKIVKYNEGVMGKNWIHLRDGSGSDKDETNDIIVTTANAAKLGDVVTVKGVVHTDKDFGAGYSYKVLIEDATVQK